MHPFSPLSVTTLASLFTASPVLAFSPVYSSYVAFGDSFSAGPGAGSPYPNDPVSSCQRYAGAYPVQYMQDQLAEMPGFQFQFSAWSRAQVLDVLNSQSNDVPVANVSNASLYTLTVGGNDLGFGGLVKSCVYGLGWLAGACDDLLDAFDNACASSSIFSNNFDEQLNRIVQIAGDASKVVIMPYIKFFNGDVTDDNSTKVNCHVKQYVRLQLNTASDHINSVLSNAATNHGIRFASDKELEAKYNGHRFCENTTTGQGDWIYDLLWASLTPQQQVEFQQSYDNDTPSPFASGNTDPSNGFLNGSSASIYSRIFYPTVLDHTAYFQTLKDTVSNVVAAGAGLVLIVFRFVQRYQWLMLQC